MSDYSVYILTNEFGNVMYVGVTNDLERRLAEHIAGKTKGFSQKYKTTRLVYFEQTQSVEAAISREKQIKGWRREKKNALVETINPHWDDLHHKLTDFSGDPSLRSG